LSETQSENKKTQKTWKSPTKKEYLESARPKLNINDMKVIDDLAFKLAREAAQKGREIE
jgi:hypothetical protein